jgi:protein phosphatase
MDEKDWLAAAVVLVASMAVAYVLGRRQRVAVEGARAPARSASGGAPSSTAEPEAAPPKKQAPQDPEPFARVDYEEDQEIDPTRVGASTPPQRAIYQPPLKRIIYDEDADREEPTQPGSLFLVHATAQTDTGLRRKRNEDSLLVDEKEALFVIADGMGGYRGGELASQLTVKTIGQAFAEGSFEGPVHDGVPTEATNLARAIQMANAGIMEIAARKKELEGMGTTVCAARFSQNRKRLYIGHVGDSRCYRFRGDVLKQMTADHTMADLGVKGPESAHLSRAVGIWPTVPIDIVMAMPEAGDVYLLCSDGLTKMLRDETIASVIRNDEDPKVAVERLIFFANAKGGKDNITVILVRVVPANWKPRPSQPDMPPEGQKAE